MGESKQAKMNMISSTIELMVKKEDFSKLEDICTLTSKSVAGFHIRLRESLKSVPLNVKENLNLNLDPKVKTKLRFDENKDSTTKLAKTMNELPEDFTTKLAEENLEEVSNILLKSFEKKQAKTDMVESTIELMIKKEDFSKLEDVCTQSAKANRQFQMKISYLLQLESVPHDVLQNMNLEPKAKQLLMFQTTVMSKIAKTVL